MAEYLSCGNIMSDIIEKEDGTVSQVCIGGPALYALAGIRTWTDSCKLLTVTGADHYQTYGQWMDDNGLSKDLIHVEMENGTYMRLKYNPNDGGFQFQSERSFEYLGYLKTHPYQIEEAVTPDLKGIYMANNTDLVIWEKIRQIKERHGFKIMWELEYPSLKIFGQDKEEYIRRIREVLKITDMWSLNYNEASALFDIDREDDGQIIARLKELGDAMTFYRVGTRGAYVITKDRTCFCEAIDPFGPSVDPTGCGNCSTGAAMYAWTAGYDEADTVIMANIAAGFNAHQFGPYPRFTREDQQLAEKMRQEMRKKLEER